MDKIFADSEEKVLKTVILYGKKSDSYLYIDKAFGTTVDKNNLLNLCKKNMLLVSYDTAIYLPVCFKENTTDVAVTLYDALATTPAAVTLKSKEPTAE